MRRRSAWIAMGVAPLVLGQALVRQVVHGVWWPFWVDDVIVSILLAVCGWLIIAETTSTRARMLSAAWGATLIVIWGSTFRHVGSLPADREVYAPHLTLITMVMVILLGVSALGLALSLPTTKKPFIGTRPPKD
ncbi:MAG: hypothetical protein KF842_00730 [Caulobacter sp.]|nr:hypothetical protein [Caulobacter sp.]